MIEDMEISKNTTEAKMNDASIAFANEVQLATFSQQTSSSSREWEPGEAPLHPETWNGVHRDPPRTDSQPRTSGDWEQGEDSRHPETWHHVHRCQENPELC